MTYNYDIMAIAYFWCWLADSSDTMIREVSSCDYLTSESLSHVTSPKIKIQCNYIIYVSNFSLLMFITLDHNTQEKAAADGTQITV